MTGLFEYYVHRMLPPLSGNNWQLMEREAILNARMYMSRPRENKTKCNIDRFKKGKPPLVIEIQHDD